VAQRGRSPVSSGERLLITVLINYHLQDAKMVLPSWRCHSYIAGAATEPTISFGLSAGVTCSSLLGGNLLATFDENDDV